MILILGFLLGCVALVVFVVNAIRQRPSAIAPFIAFPLIAALLDAPIVFEEGWGGSVVTGTPETGLAAQYIAWCPDRCVNVPDRFTRQLVLPNGFVYNTQIEVGPTAATRLVWDELPQRAWLVPWAHEVEALLRARTESVFIEYLQANEIAVLRRNSNNTDDLREIAKELFFALMVRGLPFTNVWVSVP